jgi:hypothetical protein
MEISGCVQNGVVVLTNGVSLPEGAAVTVVYSGPIKKPPRALHTRVSFPLVRSAAPRSVDLTSDRIAELLDDEDAPPRR